MFFSYIRLSACVTILLLVSVFIGLFPLNARVFARVRPRNKVFVAQTSQTPAHRAGEVLVRFRAGASQADKDIVAASQGGRWKKKLKGESGVEKLELSPSADALDVALRLNLNPTVEFAEPNFIVKSDQLDNAPNDPRFSEQWALKNVGQNGGQYGADIDIRRAWQVTTGRSTTVIAVIDSGIDFTHPDLKSNEWDNPIPTQADAHGWDFITDNGEINDANGHGTAVAGLIAAQGNNAIGVSGVMWNASLMSLRVLDETGTGDVAAGVEAIDYAVAHGAQVINLSWGTEGMSLTLKDAINRALRRGVTVVCSAGNSGRDVDAGGASPYYPASFDLPDLISVAATSNADQLSSWSNFGSAHVSVAAPGENLVTTQMGGGYWYVSGTSAAAPLVSGIAGLIKTLRPMLQPNKVKASIIDSSRAAASLNAKVSSNGIVDAGKAIDSLPAVGAGNGAGPGNGNGNNGSNGNNGNGANNRGNVPTPTPGRGTGGTGPGGSFNTTPPGVTNGKPNYNLPNLDQIRKQQPTQPKAQTPIQANLNCADCDPLNGGGGASYHPSGDPNFSTARTLPPNETGTPGVDLGSRNFNWSLPLLSLPGRAGLDVDLTLYYNSLVWTRDGTSIKYNADLGSPAPGFRLGMPTLQQRYFDATTGAYSYLMVTPAGGRVELRQTGTNTYESQDGTYTYLDATNPNSLVVRTTDGTQFTFVPVVNNSEYRCAEIKDRNGNYISATYNTTSGHLLSISDTLGRVITFVYDPSSDNLTAIRQSWAADPNHDWATFSYGEVYVAPNFTGLNVNGPNGINVTVLTQVSLADGSYFTFNYNPGFGQVNKISHYAAGSHLLAYTSYNLDSSAGQTDCPRFTERRDWAENWINGAEAVTSYSVATDNSWSQQTKPDGTIHKEFFATAGWQSGLITGSEVWSGGVKQKWTTTNWTQDNTSAAYQINPRITETNIYDASGNRRRTTIDYNEGYSLPTNVREWAGVNGDQLLRRSATNYRWDAEFINRRIIGLPSLQMVYQGESTLLSKLEYHYDWPNWLSSQAPSVHHDTANYGSSFVYGRGLLLAVRRFNTQAPSDDNQAVWVKYIGYDLAGSMIWEQRGTGVNHRINISYADSFSDGNNTRGTLAYPTTTTDADGNSSTMQYNFDFGGVTRRQDPNGAAVAIVFDSAARVERVTNQFNNAYTRYFYGPNYLQTYSSVNSVAANYQDSDAYTVQHFDGMGRVYATAALHPGSTGGYEAQVAVYDNMGRVVQQSKPTEMNPDWSTAGDDATGWVYTLQAYDWKGRPTLTTMPDGGTQENTYGGCGCAGGEVSTVRDERGRRKRYTKDTLGRLVTVEELNWDQSVYSTTSYTYNALDQISQMNQAGQTRSFTFDGHGRLQTRMTPEQGTVTYAYTGDDAVLSVTDARGASSTFTYNNRFLVTGITYGLASGVAATANVSFGYDAAGNRTSMTDGLGSVSYVYNTLSQMSSETRTFTGLGTYALSYSYNLAGELTNITNPWNAQVGYAYDRSGRVTSMSGANYGGVTSYINSIAYRAFNAPKQVAYNNGRTLSLGYDSRMHVTDWSVPGVLGWQYSYTDVGEYTGRVMFAKNTASSTAAGLRDDTLDRSYDYDHLGRLIVSHSGYEARLHMSRQQAGDSTNFGPYSQAYDYDQWGNMTTRYGWGGWDAGYVNWSPSYSGNRLTTNPATGATMQYDASGNLTNDGYQSYSYDATGQQTYASATALSQGYDGDGKRAQKVESSVTTYYIRSSALGGQVVAEITSGSWTRGYVYLGGQMVAIQSSNAVSWVHQDPVTKSQRITNSSGTVIGTIDLDPWGGETATSANQAFQPHRFTSYERDGNGGDEAMMRRYSGKWHRFYQPDPYEGSYTLTDPQSLNRYSYTQNDPVNLIDPLGLFCYWRDWVTWDGSIPTIHTERICVLENDGGNPPIPYGGGGPERTGGGGPGGGGPVGGGRVGTGSSDRSSPPQRTQAEKERAYQDCVKNAGTMARQANNAIPNVFHNSSPTLRQVESVGYGTAVRAAGPTIATGSVTAAGPLIGSTVVIGLTMAWGFNVLSNTVSNAAQRGTLLGEFVRAKILCEALRQ